jgi:Domain of unknown function (DUF4143)
MHAGKPASIDTVAPDSGVNRKAVEGYFDLLDCLLIAFRLPFFRRRAERALTSHPKSYFIDAGVYRAIGPRGPLDPVVEIDGAAIEALVAQELRAVNDGLQFGYDLSFWRTRSGQEVDFVLCGGRGLLAIDVKRSSKYRESDLGSLRAFGQDYRWPSATCSTEASASTGSTISTSSRWSRPCRICSCSSTPAALELGPGRAATDSRGVLVRLTETVLVTGTTWNLPSSCLGREGTQSSTLQNGPQARRRPDLTARPPQFGDD